MEQIRKFTIAQFITTVGEAGTIILPPHLLEVLGVIPGQDLSSDIDEHGGVTVERL